MCIDFNFYLLCFLHTFTCIVAYFILIEKKKKKKKKKKILLLDIRISAAQMPRAECIIFC